MVQICLKRQREWDFKWRTFYLYGLNEKDFGGNNNSNIDEVVFRKIFPPLSRTGISEVRFRLRRNNHFSFSSFQDFFEKLNDVLQNNLYNSFNIICILLKNTQTKIKTKI